MTPFKLVTLAEVKIEPGKPVFCDTETDGLYGKVMLLQIYQEGWPEVLMVHRPNSFEVLGFVTGNHTVWHNAHYDLTTIQTHTLRGLVPAEYDDTLLLARLALPQYEEYTLDAIMTIALGYDPYKAQKLDKKVLQKTKWAHDLTQEQLLYAATDVYHMPAVWDKVKSALSEPSYTLDMSAMRSALSFQWNGMPVDSDRHDRMYRDVTAELETIPMPINANSWQQVRKWLDVEQSDKVFLSTLALRDNNERAHAVLESRRLRKLLSFLDKYDSERVIGKFKPSARSGRFTSADHNLQQIPRALKGVFGFSEDSDRVLIYSDYAQLELRTICAILGVRKMEEMFRDEVDLHGYVASVIFGEGWTKKDRQVTKTYNFNLLYGGSAKMIVSILMTYGLYVEERVANRHKAKWLRLFPEINGWQQECIAKWNKGKLNSTPFGRKYKGKLMTDFMNIQNQGAGAEVAKLAMHYMVPWLEANKDKYDSVIVNFIHDSFIIDAPDEPEVYEVVAKKLAECMQEAWFEMSKLYKITDLPMPVDVLVGKNWGDLEEGEGVMHKLQLDPYAMLEKVNAKV